MSNVSDLSREKFARLTVVNRVENDKHGKAQWLCECECGSKTIVIGSNLTKGNTKSCGCLHKEMLSQSKLKHGHTTKGKISPEYYSWMGMIQRCTNPNNQDYKDYGDRGISVYKHWKNSFPQFLADMGEKPTSKHTIDRINVDGNYEPSNCRWATAKEQANNRRIKNKCL